MAPTKLATQAQKATTKMKVWVSGITGVPYNSTKPAAPVDNATTVDAEDW